MREIVTLVGQMAPFLLLGFGLAGLMHAFIPSTFYSRYLGRGGWRSALYATLVGIPLPLCSCGVIPTAMSLRKEGASRAATVSFLIATPQTGIDSIIATYSLLGLPFAIIRPIAALITALLGGGLTILLAPEANKSATTNPKSREEKQHGGSFIHRMGVALRYAYVEMMQDIGKTLFVGLVIAGLITILLPADFFAAFADHSLLSMLIVLMAAIPMYLCATGSIPIAVALMLKGLSPGAAFVLLMAGPAANAASVMIVGKVLGRRTLSIYLASLVIGAITIGLGIDYLMPREWFTAPLGAIDSCHAEGGLSWFEIASALLLVVLLANALLRRRACSCRHNNDQTCTPTTPQSKSMSLRITGLRCNKCKDNAERALAQVEGIEEVSIELSTGIATLKGEAPVELLRGAVEALGFGLEEL